MPWKKTCDGNARSLECYRTWMENMRKISLHSFGLQEVLTTSWRGFSKHATFSLDDQMSTFSRTTIQVSPESHSLKKVHVIDLRLVS